MAGTKWTDVYARDTAERFSGMDRSGMSGLLESARDLCNFRVREDGSLEKREGYRLLSALPEEIRGVWAGNVSGRQVILAAAGAHVYLVAREDEVFTEAKVLTSLATDGGIANFFYAEGCVYLMDGAGIYCYDGEEMAESDGYAPLYAYGWHPVTGGEVHEPLNAFSRHVRLHFGVTVSTDTLALRIPLKSIEAVYHSNGRMDASYYTLSEDGLTLTLESSMASGLTVTVYGTLRDDVDNGSEVRSCSDAVTMGGEFDDRIFLYHGERAAEIYVSGEINEAELQKVRQIWPDQKKVYFSAANKLTADDGKSEVTGLCRHYDRLLVFRADGTCMADMTEGADGRIYPAMPVNSAVGCTSPGALCHYGNDPITVSETGIYRFLQTTDVRDECNAVCVSGRVAALLTRDFCRRIRCISWRRRHEVWFYDPEDSEGGVLIWRPDTDVWFRFDGIGAKACFLYGGEMCFWRGGRLYRFEEGLAWDEPDGLRQEIEAYYEGSGLHLGLPWEIKRMGRCMITYSGEGELEVTLSTDRGAERICRMDSDGSAGVRMISRRMPVGRFIHLSCRIRAAGAGQIRLLGVTLTADK